MPPTLDLSRTSHSKMIVSPPRINLRRAASYTKDGGPLSSTSSRFGFNHLIFASPPPSPGLPQLVPRPRKPSNTPRPSRVFRFVFWLCGVLLLFYLAVSFVRQGHVVPIMGWASHPHDEYEMVAQDDLPDFPTPIVITDKRGRAKWTVSIPPTYGFPLSLEESADVVAKCGEVSQRVDALHHNSHSISDINLVGSEHKDRYFLDVQEAEEKGFLSGKPEKAQAAMGEKPVCQKSLTYVLESADAGFGRTLMTLWMAYGLAQKEGRAFFVDDSRWAYGEYSAIFDPPPVPACRPPPHHEMLLCPRQARHLVVSSANTKTVFGDMFGESDDDIHSNQKAMFELAHQGYKALFHLNQMDREYVVNRVQEHKAKTQAAEGHAHNGVIVGVHVRHGDLHPSEYQYHGSYIPTNIYTERAREILNTTFELRGAHRGEDKVAKDHSLLVLASDDPMVFDSEEFRGATPAQELIRLASKTTIQQVNPDRSVMHKYVDETFGWEGGFFAAMFWNLGLSSESAVSAGKSPEAKNVPSSETVRLRSLVGRAYMMDLAVLADLSDVVICTVSAMGCRLLGVMMGWERAIHHGNWINVDGHLEWSGVAW